MPGSNTWYKACVRASDRKSQQAQMELQWRLPLPDVAVCCQVAGRQGAHEGEHLHARCEALQADIAVFQRLAALNLLLQHLERLRRDAPCLCKQDAVEVRNGRSFVTLLLRPAELRPIRLCLSRVLRILGRLNTSLPGIQ